MVKNLIEKLPNVIKVSEIDAVYEIWKELTCIGLKFWKEPIQLVCHGMVCLESWLKIYCHLSMGMLMYNGASQLTRIYWGIKGVLIYWERR